MFDIREYYWEQVQASAAGGDGVSIGEIEEDISFDIDNILKNRFHSLYLRDKFKHGAAGIDIIYPRLSYPGGRSVLKGPDHVRYLLSAYPHPGDLEVLEKVVLKPRHIDIGNIELMALYLRKTRILVMYLHQPHTYPPELSSFHEYAEHPPVIPDGDAGGRIKTRAGMITAIPPLWYILSIVSGSAENVIDKFFIRREPRETRDISRRLDEISFFYSRHGY
jgi:hypothetical protein